MADAVLTDEQVGIGAPLSDTDVGLTLSDSDVGIGAEAKAPDLPKFKSPVEISDEGPVWEKPKEPDLVPSQQPAQVQQPSSLAPVRADQSNPLAPKKEAAPTLTEVPEAEPPKLMGMEASDPKLPAKMDEVRKGLVEELQKPVTDFAMSDDQMALAKAFMSKNQYVPLSVANQIARAVDSFSSMAGLETMAAMGSPIGPAVMAKGVWDAINGNLEIKKALFDELSKAPDDQDAGKIAGLITSAGMNAIQGGLMGYGAYKGGMASANRGIESYWAARGGKPAPLDIETMKRAQVPGLKLAAPGEAAPVEQGAITSPRQPLQLEPGDLARAFTIKQASRTLPRAATEAARSLITEKAGETPNATEAELHAQGKAAVAGFNEGESPKSPIRFDKAVGRKLWQYTINVPNLLGEDTPSEATFSVPIGTDSNAILTKAKAKAAEFLPTADELFKATDDQVRKFHEQPWFQGEALTTKLAEEMTPEQLEKAKPIIMEARKKAAAAIAAKDINAFNGLAYKTKAKIFTDVFARKNIPIPRTTPAPAPAKAEASKPGNFTPDHLNWGKLHAWEPAKKDVASLTAQVKSQEAGRVSGGLVSRTKRVFVLQGKDGRVHAVSGYLNPRSGLMMVDPDSPRLAKPNRPAASVLRNYEPIYTGLLKEAKKNFARTYPSLAVFEEEFGKPARERAGAESRYAEPVGVTPSPEPAGKVDPETAVVLQHFSRYPTVEAALKAIAKSPQRNRIRAAIDAAMAALQDADPKLSAESAADRVVTKLYEQSQAAKPKAAPARIPPRTPTTAPKPAPKPATAERGRLYLRFFPPLGIPEFIKSDLKPALVKGVDAGKAAIETIINALSPASHARSADVDILFEGKGFKERVMTRLAAAVENEQKKFDRMPQAEQIAFIDRVKRGQPQPTPELQQVADLLRKWDDHLHDLIKRYKPDATYLENHYRVLWKVVPNKPQVAGATASGISSKRPFAGRKGFLKKHVLDDMSQGIAMGGVPVSYNPLEMFLLHAQDVMKFVAANRAWESYKKTGTVQFVRQFHKPPDGYVRFDDPIARPYFKTAQGVTAKPGEWWVEEGIARMLRNYLSFDFIRYGKFGAAGRSLLTLKNVTTNVELGMSPFHFIFVSNELAGSSLGLGIVKMFSGDFKAGAVDFLKALPATLGPLSHEIPKTALPETVRTGALLIRYAKAPAEFAKTDPEGFAWMTKHYPATQQLVNDLFTGGGQVGMNEDYRYKMSKGFRQAMAEGNPLGALARSLPALNELMQKPLFEVYIPRIKLGMWLREYSFELGRRSSDLAAGTITRAELARQTWAFIEDRFGELNWDNLYWDRTFKSAMQIAFRSVTWKLGNLRGFGKAGRDVWGEVIKRGLFEHKAPRMTLPMGWVIGMGLVTAIQATIISKVATGKYPWELGKDALDTIKNLTFPRIDKDDPTQRVSIPTYFRDAVHIYTSLQQDYGLGYIHSSMTGEINRLIEDWQNKDFSGKPIYNPLDPMHKRVLAKLEHLIPLPFGLSSYLRAEETGARGGKAALGFMGYTKAPSSVEPSTANRVYQMIDDWMAKSSDPKLHEKARRAAVQDQRKASEPSQYAPLRQALRVENEEGARKELAKLREAGKQDWQIQQALSYWKPVTGSWANEVAFEKSLKPDQRAMLDKLRQDRKLIYQRFIQLSKSQPSGE